MKRRDFLKQAGITAAAVATTSRLNASNSNAFRAHCPPRHWARPANSSPSSASAEFW